MIKQTSKQYHNVKTQLFRKDVSEIIIATDAGREGELVARWILDKSGCHKPIRRLWIFFCTDKAIKEGFAHLKERPFLQRLISCRKKPRRGRLAGRDQCHPCIDLQV